MSDKFEIRKTLNAEKILTYMLMTAAVLAAIVYIADIKERIRAVEVDIMWIKEAMMEAKKKA